MQRFSSSIKRSNVKSDTAAISAVKMAAAKFARTPIWRASQTGTALIHQGVRRIDIDNIHAEASAVEQPPCALDEICHVMIDRCIDVESRRERGQADHCR